MTLAPPRSSLSLLDAPALSMGRGTRGSTKDAGLDDDILNDLLGLSDDDSQPSVTRISKGKKSKSIEKDGIKKKKKKKSTMKSVKSESSKKAAAELGFDDEDLNFSDNDTSTNVSPQADDRTFATVVSSPSPATDRKPPVSASQMDDDLFGSLGLPRNVRKDKNTAGTPTKPAKPIDPLDSDKEEDGDESPVVASGPPTEVRSELSEKSEGSGSSNPLGETMKYRPFDKASSDDKSLPAVGGGSRRTGKGGQATAHLVLSWKMWLGVNRMESPSPEVLALVQEAVNTPPPSPWAEKNKRYYNFRTTAWSTEHPLVPEFKARLDALISGPREDISQEVQPDYELTPTQVTNTNDMTDLTGDDMDVSEASTAVTHNRPITPLVVGLSGHQTQPLSEPVTTVAPLQSDGELQRLQTMLHEKTRECQTVTTRNRELEEEIRRLKTEMNELRLQPPQPSLSPPKSDRVDRSAEVEELTLAIAASEERRVRELASMEDDFSRRINNLSMDHMDKLSGREKAHLAALEEKEAQWRSDREQLAQKHQEELNRIEIRHKDNLEAQSVRQEAVGDIRLLVSDLQKVGSTVKNWQGTLDERALAMISSKETSLQNWETRLVSQQASVQVEKESLSELLGNLDKRLNELREIQAAEATRLNVKETRFEENVKRFNMERDTLKKTLEDERSELDRIRHVRVSEKEEFLNACAQERKDISAERASLFAAQQKQIATETQWKESFSKQMEQMEAEKLKLNKERSGLQDDIAAFVRDRRQLESDWKDFEESKNLIEAEAARVKALGEKVHAKSEEVASQWRQCSEEKGNALAILREVEYLRKETATEKAKMLEMDALLTNNKRLLENERLQVAEEKKRVLSERKQFSNLLEKDLLPSKTVAVENIPNLNPLKSRNEASAAGAENKRLARRRNVMKSVVAKELMEDVDMLLRSAERRRDSSGRWVSGSSQEPHEIESPLLQAEENNTFNTLQQLSQSMMVDESLQE
jgi:hypothetical protein